MLTTTANFVKPKPPWADVHRFRQANDAGVDPAVIKQAQDLHSVAHTNWEWWTASNGSWFHNMPQAKESLAKSVAASQKATKLLRDAVAAKVAAQAQPSSADRPEVI